MCSETHCRKTEVITEKIINVANSEGKKNVCIKYHSNAMKRMAFG